MEKNVQNEVQTVLDILEHARKNGGRLPGHIKSFASRLRRLNQSLQESPRVQLVRPASIALHNLAITLDDGYDDDGFVLEDIDAATEALEPLLKDRTLGLTPQKLRKMAKAALTDRIGKCPMCKSMAWDVEIASNLMLEFPGEYRHPPPYIPIANVVCRRCGLMSMHKLSVLGIIPERKR